MPSRDLLVRKASPPDSVGRVFGIVTTGFNFGGMIGPLIGGALIDGRFPEWIFYGSAAFMTLTVMIALAVERKAVR
jgi:MFS family permease